MVEGARPISRAASRALPVRASAARKASFSRRWRAENGMAIAATPGTYVPYMFSGEFLHCKRKWGLLKYHFGEI
jgi:post-segregation antitoxin (ccd killing protein)